MGKTPKPRRLLVHPDLLNLPEFEGLRAQGHTVVTSEDMSFDIILGPNAWRMTQAHLKYLPLAITEARRLRYTPKETKP